jgi:NNP family nitrate/nitrite transporter-like MFS transporter
MMMSRDFHVQGNSSAKFPTRHVALGTLAFAVCFLAWGLISAFAPLFAKRFGLSATETALLVALPVLLGALARLPMGMLGDRFGGRAIFALLMLAAALPVYAVPHMQSFGALLAAAFALGLAGSSFAVGVGYVAQWTPADRHGTALGIYGLGNAGQSLAVFVGPVVATFVGWQTVFNGVALALVISGVAFAALAQNAPNAARPRTLAEMLRVLQRGRLAWVLAAFYFLTFGGFVAFSIYLPTLLRDEFKLSPANAGFRAAGFVLLATAMRPVGGWLADRIGGARVLSGVFAGIVPFGLLLAWSSMLPFSVGALGCAALLGLGNGAVFKLVPQYFGRDTGTVTGLVGALGGLGGFFPPLLLGVFRDRIGAVWPGFVLLTIAAIALWAINRKTFVLRQEELEIELPQAWLRAADRLRAGAWATLITLLLVAAIVVGSRNLKHFDAALVIYTFAVVFATWGVAYHYRVWLSKPPTLMYWRRGWQLFFREGVLRSTLLVARSIGTHLLAQRFIRRRSHLRWWMHQLIFWGCLLAVAITFPLVFGWIHFRTRPADQTRYVAYLFGFEMGSFRLNTAFAWLVFHALDIAALLVIGGVVLSLLRRMRERGAQAVQSFALDLFPLVLLFAVSVTGLALTVSTSWLRGAFYSFLALLHAVLVVAALLYLPFGKFFHIFQRPAQLGIKLYQRAGAADAGAQCRGCGERFASRMQIDDLSVVLRELGFDYQMKDSDSVWQELCPACKRATLARTQLRLKEAHRGQTTARP